MSLLTEKDRHLRVSWPNVVGYLVLHAGAFYAAFLCLTGQVMLRTFVFATLYGIVASQGILIGAHRYYSHKAFKANLALRVILNILEVVASQHCMWVWVRDHRQHHKHADTNADPHNAARGFFFSHMGWLMMLKHPDVIKAGKATDMTDLNNDAVVMFQMRYYYPLYAVFSVALPMLTPLLWNETLWNSFLVPVVLRTVILLHSTWMVNSWAHTFGTKPYEKDMLPSESLLVSILTFGEGWHNYHHTFPWDYKASEYGLKYNPTTKLIDFLAKIGMVWDRREVSDEVLKARILKSGDGSHHTAIKESVD